MKEAYFIFMEERLREESFCFMTPEEKNDTNAKTKHPRFVHASREELKNNNNVV